MYGSRSVGLSDLREPQSLGRSSKRPGCDQHRFRDETTTAEVCDQIIYPSIQLKEDIVVHPYIREGRVRPLSARFRRSRSVVASEPQGMSLAELARQTRQAPRGEVLARQCRGKFGALGVRVFQFAVLPKPAAVLGGVGRDSRENRGCVSRQRTIHLQGCAGWRTVLLLYAGPGHIQPIPGTDIQLP